MALNLTGRFHQLHNDYWSLLFIAKNIDFGNAHSLANPCIPIGYTILLHFIITFGSEIIFPIIINLLFGLSTIFASLIFYQKIIRVKVSIIAALFLGIFPKFFFYSNQGGADPGSVMFFTFGTFLLLYSLYFTDKPKWSYFLLSGVLLGIGAIFRYHVLVGAGIIISTATILNIRKWKNCIIVGAGITLAYFPQILINILTGHGAFETKLGASNIYDLMYGINWYKISTDHIPTDVIKIISSDYLLFFKRYIISFVKFFIQTGLIPAVSFLYCRKELHKRLSLFVTIFVVMYFTVFSATLSGRQILLPLPLTMLCFGLLIDEYVTRLLDINQRNKLLLKFGGVLTIFVFGLFLIMNDAKQIYRNISEYRLSKEVESFLVANEITNALQTYTTDFDLYFNNLINRTGFSNGGWSRWGTYKFNEAFPEFNVQSVDEFLEDCKKHNVQFVILNNSAEKLHNELGKIYEGKIHHNELKFRKTFQRVKIFEVINVR